MNEKKICACVGARTRDTQKSKEHYEENFIPAGWNLEYTCLDQPEVARALYLTGVCLHCGGQLGKKFNIPGELTGDALLEQIYHQMESCRPFDQRFDGGAYRTSLSMRAYWYMEQDDLTLSAKNAQFLKLFHAEDQGVVEDWISRCHAEEPYTAPRRDRKSTLLRAVLERARACGDLREIEPILDYYLPNAQEPLSSDLDSYLTNYQFSAIANISYGCEGIFVDLAIEGNFDDSGTNRCTIGTFKTLRQDNDADRLMGQLCGILKYLARPELRAYQFSTIAFRAMSCDVHHSREYWLRGKRCGRIVQLLNDDEDADDLRDSVAESVDNVIQFEEYTSTLTPLQQRIAELRDIGYSDREISAICGIPYKVVALEMEGAKRSILEVYIGDAPRAA